MLNLTNFNWLIEIKAREKFNKLLKKFKICQKISSVAKVRCIALYKN